jgi:predicted transcriptional regulator
MSITARKGVHDGARVPAIGILRATMARSTPALGDLQSQIMDALWRIDAGTVEDVRSALPSRYRGAYNTVQTVLNRLTDRGLVTRRKRGQAFEYRPALSEADFLSKSIATTLAGASSGARQAALAQLIGGLESDELEELQRLARQLEGRSRKP